MTESVLHIELVKKLKDYVKKIIEEDNHFFIYTDSAFEKELPPILITGNRPDLYYEYNNLLIIGEAKTEKDMRNRHSISQFVSYISYCNSYEGNALLIFAVPWTEIAEIKNILRKLTREKKYNFSIKIISNLD